MQNQRPGLKLRIVHDSLQLTDVSTCQFVIGMSLHKTVSIRDEEINPIGHLAVRLRGGPINLTVFGKMDKSRYIKPFVVYWN